MLQTLHIKNNVVIVEMQKDTTLTPVGKGTLLSRSEEGFTVEERQIWKDSRKP